MKTLKIILIIISLLAVIVAIGAYEILTQTTTIPTPVRIYLPKNTTKEALRDTLVHNLGDDGESIYNFWELTGGNEDNVRGSYVIKPGDNLYKTARNIIKQAQSPLNVALNNMRTIEDLANKLSAKLEFASEDYLCEIDSLLSANEQFGSKETYPAAFIPDTYNFFWNESPKRVVRRIFEEFNKFWTDERLDKAKKLGLKPVEVITLASIVAGETNNSNEQPIIARLYLNRLDKKMPLQADPTVKFAVGDFTLRRITQKHLNIDSPYNTYRVVGLPPGPIRIVDRAVVDAVLNAPMHNYIYMCAKEDFSGLHNFATTYSEHQRNAARYQAELNRRGIR